MTEATDRDRPIDEAYGPIDDDTPEVVTLVRDDVLEGLAGKLDAVEDSFEWLGGDGWKRLVDSEPVAAVVWRLRARAAEKLVGKARAGVPVTLDGTTYVFREGDTPYFKRYIAWFEALSGLGLVGAVRPVLP
jgi:hypothetical protein